MVMIIISALDDEATLTSVLAESLFIVPGVSSDSQDLNIVDGLQNVIAHLRYILFRQSFNLTDLTLKCRTMR